MQRDWKSAIGAGFLFIVALVPEVSSQSCPPWSKRGLTRVTDWAAGSTLQVGRIDTGAAGIALTFEFDAACGAVARSVGHRGTRKDGTVALYEYSALPPTGCPRGLWSARFRPVDSQVPVEMAPSDAADFELWVDDTTQPSTAIFCWTGMQLTECCDFYSWMELRLDVTGNRAQWHSRLGRLARPHGDEQFTLDEVFAPIVYTRQPTFDARILVPIAGTFTLPDVNLPLSVWAAFNIDLELEHPARGQQMQFSSVYTPSGPDFPLGDDVFSARRKILYFSTEDTRGYYKRFKHRAVVAGGQLAYQWAPIYFPTYGPAPFINFHISRYPAVMCALEAETDSFWYDVCEHYRDFVDRRMPLTPITSRWYRLNRDFVDASPFVATSSLGVLSDLPAIYERFVDEALLVQKLFAGADGDPSPMFMEWQKWLKGDATPVPAGLGEDPIGPDFNPRPFSGADVAFKEPTIFARDQIARANAAGVNMSVYTLPLVIDQSDWPNFPESWFLFARDGTFGGAGPRGGNFIDYGRFGVPLWMVGVLYDDILDSTPDLGGIFMDVFSGGGAFLRYPEDPGHLFKRRYHGGTVYVRGQVRTMDMLRYRLAWNKPTRRHPDVPLVLSETVSEFFAGHYDFAQHGLKPVPYQMWHNTLFDFLGGIPPGATPVEASHSSPPLWNCVYHEYSRAEGLTVALSKLGVSGLFGGGQFNPFFPGMTYPQWGDYMRMVHALWYFQGMKPTSFQYIFGFEPFNLLKENEDGSVGPVDEAVPQQAQLLAFLKRLHESLDRHDEAGQFLSSGRMERPLQIPNALSPFVIQQSATPAFAPAILVEPGSAARHFYEDPFTSGVGNTAFGLPPYTTPHVFHSVWSARTGRYGTERKYGIVFVNWTDQPSYWEGVFDPSCYPGLGESFTIKGLRPEADGVVEYAVGTGTGPTPIAWNPASSGIRLEHFDSPESGLMPARSVQVFVIE